ncbi:MULTISPECIES: beta-N-acetylhexosaminidase [Vibrio]|uniref:beta-N-acetylhexosaminidase n=1 Tax=Vibrio TaxID=662 RepID=UPI0001B955CD|nr:MULTISPECIES: beta-N-acetylhexosaminidase [Vibrio]EEX35004.1 beta N-acetyl-glucosaminidase [Vibrio coralliilyticus ATCC BAA-450]MCM5510280.1 beta-N-acetylhexosaminidase [Vibrio sp. SCSIO 43169]MDE3900007.1 beta-N-acetylhexosaminidase [Vibrio sp. CC007]NRF16694.1 beta-N-acetylhexosaminidase [Vibrio coralliilyticus]NRF64196.1 beta-N-acetylhexosaminidase [Vibrio coralliilyticus]
MGPLWVDVEGCELTAEDREILEHPTVGGVILFARNYHDNEQLLALNKSIRQAAKRPILIGVDQEGGRVQRFKEGFSLIPAAESYAKQANGEKLAEQGGWLMAAELIAHDIDLSFAPVLDKGHECKAIGSRSFGEDVDTIIRHSNAYMRGMKAVGMATTGKHFPGHGGVIADSHLETPYDQRDTILEQDMAIFKAQIEAGLLDAMMPAHVVFPHYDDQPASGSEFWLKNVLRKQLGFNGIIFSDDLTMEGASVMGGPAERAHQSLASGCDMVLVCNKRDAQIEVLDNLPVMETPQATELLKKQSFTLSELRSSNEWKQASEAMKRVIG